MVKYLALGNGAWRTSPKYFTVWPSHSVNKCIISLFRLSKFQWVVFITGRSVGFCMLCELQRHIVRSFGHHQGETIKPMAIIQKLKCKLFFLPIGVLFAIFLARFLVGL